MHRAEAAYVLSLPSSLQLCIRGSSSPSAMIAASSAAQLLQPLPDRLLVAERLCQPDVDRVVAGLGLEQRAVEIRQLGVGDVLPQQVETLARAGLDQTGDQQPVDGPIRLAARTPGRSACARSCSA